jgi:hypothetical protein
MNRLFSPVAALLAALAFSVSGCAEVSVVGGVDIAKNYQPEELRRYGSGGNELRVEVHGDPFGSGSQATARATVDAMQGQNIGNPVTFALDPAQEAKPPSKVVIYFNPRGLVGSETWCDPREPITIAPAGSGSLRVNGAWCQSNYVISSASARIGSAGGLESQAFRGVVGELTRALFPPVNPHRDTDRRFCFPRC